MAESVVSSLVKYLGGPLVQEAKLLGGVANQIDKIRVEMMQMQCFLKDADAKQNESEGIHNLVADIRDLAYNAEDLIETYILKAKNASNFNPKKPIRLHQIGEEIKMLQSKIQDITRRVATYNFIRIDQGEGTSSTTERQQQLRRSRPHYDDEDVIGIEDNLKVLVAELINKKGPRLVSIAGMGGLGKTTLAKKVYNHGDVKRHFDFCFWSFISQQFQVRTFLEEIIKKVPNQCKEKELENLTDEEKVYKLLQDKCYLVVLDDIWRTDAWDDLKYIFPKGKEGSKIMLTTRNKEVALYADPLCFLHEPAYLTEEQSWELFYKKAFFWKNVASISSSSSYPPKADAEMKEKLGRDMVKKCKGLPLAVVVLGCLLAMKQSIREWEMVAKDIGRFLNKTQQQQQQLDVLFILSLSYQDLPSYLKPCFLYLGLYPEDSKFHKRELIQMWISEGFVQHKGQGTTKEKIGEEYLVQLINRSMVQVAERSFHGNVQICHLHDLMRDLCLQKAKEENFIYTFDHGSSTSDSPSSFSTSVVESISDHRMRRHAIHSNCDRYVSMQQTTRNPHLRAFSLWRPSNYWKSIVTMKFVCKKFKFLRVLVLEDIRIGSLPEAIGKLIHLRYLRVTGVSWDFIGIPPSISNLRSLQFLTLIHVRGLPNVLWKMEQLTYCCVRDSDLDKSFRMDGLKNLSTLEFSGRKEVWLKNALPILTNLRKLFLYDIEVNDCKSLHRFLISRLDCLQCLSLKYHDCPSYGYDWSPLSSCCILRKLYIDGVSILPKLKEFPPNVTKLCLKLHVRGEENPIPTLEMLPNLETLRIGHHIPSGNDWLPYNFEYYFSKKGFGRLQYLQLQELLVHELEMEKGALPRLVHLQIMHCRNLKMLPEGLRFITSLNKLEVIDMPDKFNKRLKEGRDDWHKIQHIHSIIIR